MALRIVDMEDQQQPKETPEQTPEEMIALLDALK